MLTNMENLNHQVKTRKMKFPFSFLFLSGIVAAYSTTYAQQPTNTTNDYFPKSFNWGGAYLGGYIGGAWGQSNMSTYVNSLTATPYFDSTANINSVNQSGSRALNSNVFIGGIQFNDNFVLKDRYILGLTLDYGALNLNASNAIKNAIYPDGSGDYSLQTSINTDWFYTVKGRLGYIVSSLSTPLAIYTTGGLAVTNLSVSNTLSDNSALLGVGGGITRNNPMGWTVGAGFELPIIQNLTINAEYLYMQFGTVTINSSIYNSAQGFGIDSHSLVSPFNTSAHLSANLFKVGLNYKFEPINFRFKSTK